MQIKNEPPTFQSIIENSKRFKVSREAYLRRLKELNYVDDSSFFNLLEKIKQTYKKKQKAGRPTHSRIMKASRGTTFYSLVLDAVRSNLMSYTEGAKTLGIRANKLANEFQ